MGFPARLRVRKFLNFLRYSTCRVGYDLLQLYVWVTLMNWNIGNELVDGCIFWSQTHFHPSGIPHFLKMYHLKYSCLTLSSWAMALFPIERMCRFCSVSSFSMTEMRLLNKLKSCSFTRESSPSITSILLNDRSEEYKNSGLVFGDTPDMIWISVGQSVLTQPDQISEVF